MKKLLIGIGSVGVLSTAPVIAYLTTHNSTKSNNVGTVDHYALLSRLRDSAANLSQADSQPVDFIRKLDNRQDTFMTTQGMYDSVKKQLVGRNLIQDHYNVYQSGDEARVVFYYDKGESTTINAPTNEAFDLFPDQSNIRATLEKSYWGNDLLIDSNRIDAVVIFTIDKNNNVTNVASGVRHPETKVEFQYIEEMLIFETDRSVMSSETNLSNYIWIPKYGMACDMKNTELPFRYLFDERQKLVHGAPLATTNIFGFNPVKDQPGLLTWIPTEGYDIPVLKSHSAEVSGVMEVPSLDRETLQVPMITPELFGNTAAIPMLIPLPEAQSAPTLITNHEERK